MRIAALLPSGVPRRQSGSRRYHNVEHTLLVTLGGHDSLRGRGIHRTEHRYGKICEALSALIDFMCAHPIDKNPKFVEAEARLICLA